MPSNYPLTWPVGRKRTTSKKQGSFKNAGGPLTLAQAVDRVMDRLDSIRASEVVISTNVQPTLAGSRPRSGQAEPSDPGVAIYCTWRKRSMVFACDTYTSVVQNMAAAAAHITAMQAIERYGVATAEEVFMGHMQLPAQAVATVRPWHEVLGVSEHASEQEVRAAHRRLMAKHHPDAGGSHETAAEINDANDRAAAYFAQHQKGQS